MLPQAIPLALGATLLHAAADSVPTLNVESGCRAAAKMGDQLSLDTTLRQCLADERGARNDREAKLAAHAVATSPLVKTALYGGDPNWGRILAAVGRSGARFSARMALERRHFSVAWRGPCGRTRGRSCCAATM